MLGALRLGGRAARVHQEERRLGRHRHRLHDFATIVGEHLVNEEVAALYHLGLRRVFPGVPAPDEDLIDLEPFLLGGGDGLFRLDLMIQQLAVSVVGVHGDEHTAP